MAPEPGDRISAILRALEEVLIPAIDPARKLAIEQARMCVTHLRLLQLQVDHTYPLAMTEVRLFARLLAQLKAGADGAIEDALRASLDEALANPINALRIPSLSDVRAVARGYRELADTVIRTADASPDEAMRASVAATVLDHSLAEERGRRAWTAASGLEPDPGSLPSIDEAVSDAILPLDTFQIAMSSNGQAAADAKAFVMGFVESWAGGFDPMIQAMRDCLTADCIWRNTGFPDAIGRDVVVERLHLAREKTGLHTIRGDIRTVLVDLPYVVVERAETLLREDGHILADVDVLGFFELAGGKIKVWSDHFDPSVWPSAG